MSREEFAVHLSELIDRSTREVRVRHSNGTKRTVTCWEVIVDRLRTANPAQYQTVVSLQISPDYRLLCGILFELADVADDLGLKRKYVPTYLKQSLSEFLPDSRPESVRRGEICEKVLGELKQIRERKTEFRSFSDLEKRFPDMQVVQIVKGKPFDEEFRDILARPELWSHLVTYGTGILKKALGTYSEDGIREKSDHTIKQYRKSYKSWLKAKRTSRRATG